MINYPDQSVTTGGAAMPQQFGQLSAVKQSPIDERLSSITASLNSLEDEINNLRKQLAPVCIEPNAKEGSATATPRPVLSQVENSLTSADERITLAWQALSALRAQLRV